MLSIVSFGVFHELGTSYWCILTCILRVRNGVVFLFLFLWTLSIAGVGGGVVLGCFFEVSFLGFWVAYCFVCLRMGLYVRVRFDSAGFGGRLVSWEVAEGE